MAVTPDPRFERTGDDLHTTVHIGMTQAALGTELVIETLETPRGVIVPPGTQNGHVEKLKGAGIPHLRGRGRGDLYLHIVVDTPVGLSPRQVELLRELAGERGEGLIDHPDGVLSRIRSAFG